MEGTVKWFNPDKGFGFIKKSDGPPDVFVHQTGIAMQGYRSLEAGQHVEFEIEEAPKGLQAVRVTVIG